MILTTVIIIIAAYILCLIAFFCVKKWLKGKIVAETSDKKDDDFYGEQFYEEQNIEDEGIGDTAFGIEHQGLKVFNIPFIPEVNEVFYIENEYDKEANLFILENIDMIKDVLASRGLTFVYLPLLRVSREMIKSMVTYYTAGKNDCIIDNDELENGLKSSFLLDYMVNPYNRSEITHGFCWYNTTKSLFDFKKSWYVFDYISFDGAEARKHPKEFLECLLPELGKSELWAYGVLSVRPDESVSLADDNFDEETKNILSEIREKLNQVRLKGVSEAVIARYVNPCPKLSRMTISNSFVITLNDYSGTEITMEPIVKAVFIFFLRHKEGVLFKNLSDYQIELEIIYRAIKAKKNDIDEKLNSGFTPKISDSVKNLTDSTSNSINEKCTRIKEAFIVHFHDSIASNYYVQGTRATQKLISIPRNLVIWEE